jgi:hypothetical protein
MRTEPKQQMPLLNELIKKKNIPYTSWSFLEVCLTNAAHEKDHKLTLLPIRLKNKFKIDKDPAIKLQEVCAMPNYEL